MTNEKSRSRGLFADILHLISGTTLGQILSLGVAPVLTRLYAPGAFGELALFVSLAALLGIVACLRYELAIPLPKEDEDAMALLKVAFLSCTLISLFSYFLIVVIGEVIVELVQTPQIEPLLVFLPVLVFTTGMTVSLIYWSTRKRRFSWVAAANFLGALGVAAGKLVAGFLGAATGTSLILATLAGQGITLGILLAGSSPELTRTWRVVTLKTHGCQQAKRYRKFPLIDSWGAFLNNLSWQLPPLLFASFFASAIVGFYALAFRVIQLPMSLIGNAIGHVFYPTISERHAQGEEIGSLMDLLTCRLIEIGILPAFVLGISGPKLFEFCFGTQWLTAGTYAQILSPWFFVWFLAWPLCLAFNTLERQGTKLFYDVLIFCSRLLSIGVGCKLGNPELALTLFSATGLLVYGALVCHVLLLSGSSFLMIGKKLLIQTAICSLCVFPALLAVLTQLDALWIFLITGGCAFLYLGVLVHTDPELKKLVVTMLPGVKGHL